jgi:hypothetical protein
MFRPSALLAVLMAATACEKHVSQPRPAPVNTTARADVPTPEAGPHQTIILGKSAVVPDATTIGPSTTINFQNLTFDTLTIRFIAPKNMKSLVSGSHVAKRGQAPWLVFYWDDEERLVADMEPGRIGSICCLAPGKYSYTVAQTFVGSPSAGSSILGSEATITVK